MDLEEFPFDVEDLTISYRLRHSTREAVIVPFLDEKVETEDGEGSIHGGSTGGNKRSSLRFALPALLAHQKASSGLALVDLSHANVTLPDYLLFKPAPYCWMVEEVRYFGRKCSTVTVQLNFERSYLYYMLNVVIIEFGLVCVNLGAWALPQKKGGRLVFDLILILTAINFRGMVASKLPEIGYLTLLDYYILICFSFKIFAFAFHVTQVWKPKLLANPDADEASAMAYIIAVFAVHILFGVYVVKKRWVREAEVRAQVEVARQGNVKLQHSSMQMRSVDDVAVPSSNPITEGFEKLKKMLLTTPEAKADDGSAAATMDSFELNPVTMGSHDDVTSQAKTDDGTATMDSF
jgi:hypothetical protein